MPSPNVNQRIRLLSRLQIASEIDAFLIDRQARGLSPCTVTWYAEKLGIFRAYLEAQGVTEVLAITPDLLRRYLLFLSESHNAGGVHGCYRALRAFLRWYEAETEPKGWVNPIAKVREPRVGEEPLEPVDLNVLAKMLATCERHMFTGDRDRALLMFLLDTGCRRSEICALNVGDVNLQTGAVLVRHGKGGKTRVTFIGSKTRRTLVAYLRHRPHARDDDPLWCTDEYERLSHNGLREIVRRRAKRAKVPAPSLHSFRRGFAIAALRGGMDVITLQRLLGHSSLAVVSRYLKQVESDLQRAHIQAGMVDKLLR